MATIAPQLFGLDPITEIERVARVIHQQVHTILRKEGVVIAVSGGIDSSVCAALCVRGLGARNVFALALPERHSSTTSTLLAEQLCSSLDIPLKTVSIEQMLQSAGCYGSQNASLKEVFPDYKEGDPFKIVLPSILAGERLNLPRVTWRGGNGSEHTARIPRDAYLQLVAATNLKQRIRTMTAYTHADRMSRAVCGTPNRLEYDQGFFVKGGDGLSDLAPIAHLYKSQVYALGGALGLPPEILTRQPTTDTYPLEQSQEEFYFSAPYVVMDACLYGVNNGQTPDHIAASTGLSVAQVERIISDIEAKRRATQYLHLRALTVERIEPIDTRIGRAVDEGRL